MNISSLVSFLFGFSVLGFGLVYSTDKVEIFFDMPSLFIVFGGSIAATAISFEMNQIILLSKVFIGRVLLGKKTKFNEVINEIMKIAEIYRIGSADLDKNVKELNDPFLKDGLFMLNEEIYDDKKLFTVLKNRSDNLYQIYMAEANKFQSISKFPPAFGMMGTTIGMIVLLSNLGGADAAKTIGPAMSVCLITTLYGVALANLVIVPVAENLIANTREIRRKNKMIIKGLQHIKEKSNPMMILDDLNSFLKPGDRIEWKP